MVKDSSRKSSSASEASQSSAPDSSQQLQDDCSYRDIIELVVKFYGETERKKVKESERKAACVDRGIDCSRSLQITEAQDNAGNAPIPTRPPVQNTNQANFPDIDNTSDVSLRMLLGPSMDETAVLILCNIELLYEFVNLCSCYGRHFIDELVPLLRSLLRSSNNCVRLLVASTILMMLASPLVSIDCII
ncbi:unnamed protein product [Phyllotreta striolata]|uniref:Uncharacterized protein n=1 Tax=Phyllotreta striolata TaxID=444603 RepID=A0A9N9TTX1_PHYSR|nr:unnamed protein product [Phyllotreta striolata]